jgi:hypothetical protein
VQLRLAHSARDEATGPLEHLAAGLAERLREARAALLVATSRRRRLAVLCGYPETASLSNGQIFAADFLADVYGAVAVLAAPRHRRRTDRAAASRLIP